MKMMLTYLGFISVLNIRVIAALEIKNQQQLLGDHGDISISGMSLSF